MDDAARAVGLRVPVDPGKALTGLTRMMFSVYDAKARFSELLRLVRGRGEVVITQHGRPVARLVPFDDAEEEETLDQRLGRLAATGLLSRPASDPSGVRVPAGARSAGALGRFLQDRE